MQAQTEERFLTTGFNVYLVVKLIQNQVQDTDYSKYSKEGSMK